jgi:hypothetical protein
MANQKITRHQTRKIHRSFIRKGLYKMSIDELRREHVFLSMENTVLRMKLQSFKNDRTKGNIQKKINYDIRTHVARLLAVHVLQRDGTLTEDALKRERDELENEQLKKEGISEQPSKPMIPDTIIDKALGFIKSEKKKLGF